MEEKKRDPNITHPCTHVGSTKQPNPPPPLEERGAAANHAPSLGHGRRVDILITYGMFVEERAGVQAFVMTFMCVFYLSSPR